MVFHAGTRSDGRRLFTAGGRVLCLVGKGADLTAARESAYLAAGQVRWEGIQMRDDVAEGLESTP
jgi:phosphoribosylamine--glycine ligase